MKTVFPQTPSPNPDFNREGGLTFRDLAAIEFAAQMSGAITFSALDDGKKAKNLAAIPTIAVELAEALEAALDAPRPTVKVKRLLVLPKEKS